MAEHQLLYLSRSDVAQLTSDRRELLVSAVERALEEHARGRFVQPLKPYLRWRGEQNHIGDRIIAMPAYLGGRSAAAGIKWIGSKHDNPTTRNLERASALIVLNDVETHYPVAILEGGLISNLRTAAVTALAARHLARPTSAAIACIGSGPIGRMQVELLLDTLPSVASVHLFDRSREATGSHEEHLARTAPGVEVCVHDSAQSAVSAGDVVVTATVSSQPYLEFEWLKPGAFLSNVSIMDAKEEVFLRATKVVVDDWDQCNREKKIIHQLVQSGKFDRSRLHAELGQILVGDRPGRESDDEIILLNPMGMAIEDIACGSAVYRAALNQGVGTWLPL